MKLSNKYKTSEYIFLFSILVLALLLGTYFSFYAFLMRDIKSDIKGFSKDLHMNAMNYQEGMASMASMPSMPSMPSMQNKKRVEPMNAGAIQGTGLAFNFNPKMRGNIPA
jgi:hypothetical protein